MIRLDFQAVNEIQASFMEADLPVPVERREAVAAWARRFLEAGTNLSEEEAVEQRFAFRMSGLIGVIPRKPSVQRRSNPVGATPALPFVPMIAAFFESAGTMRIERVTQP